MKLDRIAMFGMPALAGLVVILVLLGPGTERLVLGARAYGVACRGATRFGMRVRTMGHYDGVYQPLGDKEIALRIVQGGAVIGSWQGRVDESGLADASGKLDRPLDPTAMMHISFPDSTTALAQGPFKIVAPLGLQAPIAAVVNSGAPRIAVHIPRGFAVPEFAEAVVISVWADAAEASAKPKLTLSGGELQRIEGPREGSCQRAPCPTEWTAWVKAKAPAVQLTVEAKGAAGPSRWHGTLAIQPGRMWVAPGARSKGQLKIGAAIPKRVAYVSLLSPKGRLWGTKVAMKTDRLGFSTGSVKLPELPDAPLTVVVSSDDNEQAQSSVGWPLDPAKGTVPPTRVVQLLDGMPSVIAREESRQKRARWPALGLVLVTGIFELLMLWRQGKRSRAELEAHITEASDTGGEPLAPAQARSITGSMGVGWLIVLTGARALGFFILAAVALYA